MSTYQFDFKIQDKEIKTKLVPRSRKFELYNGIINRMEIDRAKAITPLKLLGIDRKIAYAKRKYHSGDD